MDIQIRIRVQCSVCPTTFEGWLDAVVAGQSNNVMLKSPLPPDWNSRSFEGSGEPEPICPKCTDQGYQHAGTH